MINRLNIYREALNLTESPTTHGIKRERDTGNDFDDRDYAMQSNKKSALHHLHSQLQQSQNISSHNHFNEHRRRSLTPSPNHRNRSMEREHNHEHRNGLLGKF